MSQTSGSVEESVRELADRWRSERRERQARRRLHDVDFADLEATGFLRTVVPIAHGGTWEDMATSTRGVCVLLRTLAGGDPSVALVASMHPAVVGFWLVNPDPGQPAWENQRAAVFETAVAGRQWGTITSEPGSGGDVMASRAPAAPAPDVAGFIPGEVFRISGDKHFGSGSGIVDHMMTVAVPDGADEPAMFSVDVRDRPWETGAGVILVAEWDGSGMAATQSHAMRFESMPAVRAMWDRPLAELGLRAGAFANCLYTSVVLGVLDEAMSEARAKLTGRIGSGDELRPYEQTEWTRADIDHWVAVQAWDGALRAVESGDPVAALGASLRAKEAVAELAESTLSRLTRVLGGGTYSRSSPFSHWFADVRALGFLRPPWGLAWDSLYALSLPDVTSGAERGRGFHGGSDRARGGT